MLDTTTVHWADRREGSPATASGPRADAAPGVSTASEQTPASGPVEATARLGALDGLRLVLALAVMAFHYLAEDHASLAWGQRASSVFPSVSGLAAYGWLGVEVFFMISGFVICMSSWGRTPGAFLRSRFCRLYPAYWVAVCLTFVVVTAAPVLPRVPTVADAIANLTMLQDPLGAVRVDGVYWTLWVELRFYLLFTLLVALGVSYRSVVLFAGAWTVLGPLAGQSDSPLLTLVLIPGYAPYFLVGIGFYLLHRFGNQPLTWLIIGANVAVCLWRTHARIAVMLEEAVDGENTYLGVVLLLGAAFGFLWALARGRLAWMSGRWLTVAGALSYPVYLLHQMIGYTLIHHLHAERNVSAHVVLAVTVTVVLVLAWIVHRFVERPLARRLRRALSRPGLLNPRPAGQA